MDHIRTAVDAFPWEKELRNLSMNNVIFLTKRLRILFLILFALKELHFMVEFKKTLPRPPLITIYKSFIRPHLDYEVIIYDQAYNVSFHQKLDSIQKNFAPAITGAIRAIYREELYHELGFDSLESRRWYRKLCYRYNVFKTQSPKYLFDVSTAKKPALLEMMISYLIPK